MIDPGVFECGCLWDGEALHSSKPCGSVHGLPPGTVYFRHYMTKSDGDMPTKWPDPYAPRLHDYWKGQPDDTR